MRYNKGKQCDTTTSLRKKNVHVSVLIQGVAVAPPTTWLFYDSVYTERYMGLPTPTDNGAAYESSSLLTDGGLEALRGKTYMLNHGVAGESTYQLYVYPSMTNYEIFFNFNVQNTVQVNQFIRNLW